MLPTEIAITFHNSESPNAFICPVGWNEKCESGVKVLITYKVESDTKSETETQTGISKNEQPALLNEVINLWLSVEVYRVKLCHEHYMAKLNQVLDPLLTLKDAPELVKVPVQLLLIFAKLFSSSKKTEPKNVSLDQLIGMDTAISQMRKIIRFS
ncbi:hypothetical protein Tco_0827503 [Tanacetum coccineum]